LRYFESNVTTKRDITLDILHTIQKTGQFIVLKDKLWFPINDEMARQKIAHAIQYQIRTVIGKIRENSSPVSDTNDIPVNRDEPTTIVPSRTTDENGSQGNVPESCYSNQQVVYGLPLHDPDSFRYQLASTMTPNECWYQQWQIQEQNVPHEHHWVGSQERQYQSYPYMSTDYVDTGKSRNHDSGNMLQSSSHVFDSSSHSQSIHGLHAQDLNSIEDRKFAPQVNSLDSSGISLWNGSDFESNCDLGNESSIFTSLPLARSHYPEHSCNTTTTITLNEKSQIGGTDNAPTETASPRDDVALKDIAINNASGRSAPLSSQSSFVLPTSSVQERCSVTQVENSTSSPMDCLVRAASDFSRDDSYIVNDDSKGQLHSQ
jgi:hypothetical protein